MTTYLSPVLLIVYGCLVAVYSRGLAGPSHDKLIVCYVSTWSIYRPGAGSFDIHDIEPSLCTHLIFCFVGIDKNTFQIRHIDPFNDLEENNGKGAIKRFVGIKEKHKHLKISVAIGGWNEGSAKFSKMAGDPRLRDIFISSVLDFLDIHKFDGLDLHWNYPTQRGGKSEDRKNFVTLIKELSEAFETKGYLLTAALRPGKDDMNTVYDLVHVNYYLDFMHLMTYDYHGAWDGVVNVNAPIKGQNNDDIYSIEYTMNYLLSLGMTPSKMILGLPMYGRTFELNVTFESEVKFGETATKTTGFAGPFSKTNGFMGYNEICLELSNKSSLWVKKWDAHTSTAYIYDNKRFITYDNPRSIANKVKYAMDLGLGGVTAWTISDDDFRGACDEEPDTYKDYIDRYNNITDIALLQDALIRLKEAGVENQYYVIVEKIPRLCLPKGKFSNYPLLKIVNEAIELAGEEIQVFDELERIRKMRNKGFEGLSSPCTRTCTEICYYGL